MAVMKNSDAVKAVREKLGYTQERLSKEIGCSINTVRRAEYESRLFTNQAVMDNFRTLAKRADISLEEE